MHHTLYATLFLKGIFSLSLVPFNAKCLCVCTHISCVCSSSTVMRGNIGERTGRCAANRTHRLVWFVWVRTTGTRSACLGISSSTHTGADQANAARAARLLGTTVRRVYALQSISRRANHLTASQINTREQRKISQFFQKSHCLPVPSQMVLKNHQQKKRAHCQQKAWSLETHQQTCVTVPIAISILFWVALSIEEDPKQILFWQYQGSTRVVLGCSMVCILISLSQTVIHSLYHSLYRRSANSRPI